MEKQGFRGEEKREYRRMAYPASARPIFRFRGQALEIKDVSRGGLRFGRRESVKINGWVNGRIAFQDGTDIELEGIVVRIDKKDMGISFIGELKEEVFARIIKEGNARPV